MLLSIALIHLQRGGIIARVSMASRRFVPRWLPSAWHTPFQSNPFRPLSSFITSPLRREEGGEDRAPRSRGGAEPLVPQPGTKGATEQQHRAEFGPAAKAFEYVVVDDAGKRKREKEKIKATRRVVELFSLVRGRGTAPVVSSATPEMPSGQGERLWAVCVKPPPLGSCAADDGARAGN